MELLFDPEPTPRLPIVGMDKTYPVRRVYCVGRNYAEHAREMGHDPRTEKPFFFQKPTDAVLHGKSDFPYPPASSDVHFEAELVIAIGKRGSGILVETAHRHIFGYAFGLDMTRRDLQADAKKKGRPWATAKGFDHSAPMSAIVPASNMADLNTARIWLEQNGTIRQDAKISDMTWSIVEVISHLSDYFELYPGDLIMTGTPAGVGPVAKGDTLSGGVDGVGTLSINVI